MKKSQWMEEIENAACSSYETLMEDEIKRLIIKSISEHSNACTFTAIQEAVKSVSYGTLRRDMRILTLAGVVQLVNNLHWSKVPTQKLYYIVPDAQVYSVLERAIPEINQAPILP